MKKLILAVMLATTMLPPIEARTAKPKPTPVHVEVAPTPTPVPTPISPNQLLNEASEELTSLETDLDKANTANKQTQASLQATTLQLSTATTKDAQLQVEIENQTVALNKATADAVYWHAEQIAALKKLDWWRGIAIAIGVGLASVVGLYIAVKFGWMAAL